MTEPAAMPRPASTNPVRFMMDHMVIRLGKYLRVIGCDAAWNLSVRTHELIARANAEGRVFVTRNRQLPFQYPQPAALFLLTESDPARQLHLLVEAFGIDPHGSLFKHCIRCNVPLRVVGDKTAIRERVHPNVYVRHERFYACPSCATVFWHGSHVTNTCRKLGLTPPTPPGRAS